MEKIKSEVISGVRACLISTKGKVELRQLDNDYRTLVGERIPYFKMGFKNLEEFVRSEPTLVVSKNSNGEVYVDAKTSAKSAHIGDMVAKQKPDKKKQLGRSVRFPPYITPAATDSWRPRRVAQPRNGRQSYAPPSRLTKMSHYQFVDRPTYENKHTVMSKVVVPETSGLHPKNQVPVQRQNSEPKKSSISSRLHLAPQASQEAPVDNNENQQKQQCSSLSSTRKRITQKMSELSLEKHVGNNLENLVGNNLEKLVGNNLKKLVGNNLEKLVGNGTVNPFSETPSMTSPLNSFVSGSVLKEIQSPKAGIVEFVRTNDPIADLKTFAALNNLGVPDVSSKVVKKSRLFTCLIKVGKHSYSSYPEPFDSSAAAEKFCSEEALKDLIPKYAKRKSLLLASDKDILERIPPMLEKHPHGIWGWQLQLDYADKYNEQLPADWLKVIDSSPCIQVEKCLDNYVLRHCKPGNKGMKWNMFMTLSDVSVPSNTVRFGEDNKLFAQVTYVMAANEIWCRQYSTKESEVYNEMVIRMEAFYNTNHKNLKAEHVTEDGYYATLLDNTWHRVRAVTVTDTEVNCFFIDYGDEIVVAKDDIYQLKREYAVCQAQAFVCRLAELEELYEASINSEKIQSILYKQVILEMAPDSVTDDNDPSIPVFMYDFESGNSINQEMITLLAIESASPVIQKETITEVFVSHIESNGDVYVQLHSHGYVKLQTLLSDLENQVLTDQPTDLVQPVTRENSSGKLYFAKYKMDGHWYRIQLIDWSPAGELAQIYFVDYGNTDVIKVKEDVLYPLDKLSDILSQYPFQAVKVKMAIEEIPSDFVELAKKEMPEDQPVLLKIIEYDNNNVPWVEFFKRNADGGLFCINKSITMEAELKKGGASSQKTSKKKLKQFDSNKNVPPSGGTLPSPPLPNKGEYFEVHIPFSVNPYNFFVQPLASRTKLYKMMNSLQERYKDVTYSPLHVEQIVPGHIYASKHDDGFWYRTSVIKVIHSGSISVFYCDFGYYGSLNVQQLIPLDIEFMELPYQALKAKLAGIKPKQSKWTMEDCETFNNLILKKNFYSIILDMEKDELYESDIVLKLILIDTSSEEDIYIGKELINKGMAVEA